ncbi:MAG TPA: hypothetical protein VFY14_14590 [Streptomyces sp.]|nr:hypothetical protein [Streptomyces sp.]
MRFEVVFTGTMLPGPALTLDHAGFRLEGGAGYTLYRWTYDGSPLKAA